MQPTGMHTSKQNQLLAIVCSAARRHSAASLLLGRVTLDPCMLPLPPTPHDTLKSVCPNAPCMLPSARSEVVETLELLAEHLGMDQPPADTPAPCYPPDHPLHTIGWALMEGCACQVGCITPWQGVCAT